MLGLASIQKVYLACGSTDMRKLIDSLAAIVQQSFASALLCSVTRAGTR
ncbi:IS66 family insertion sequence element accessory protein TnpB [Caldicoprobacter guelmensis]